jgi:hypothetical protein
MTAPKPLTNFVQIQFGMLMLNSAEQFLAQSEKVAKICPVASQCPLSAVNNLRITEWFYEIWYCTI